MTIPLNLRGIISNRIPPRTIAKVFERPGTPTLPGTCFRGDVTVAEEIQVGQMGTVGGDAVQIFVADNSRGR